MDELRRKKKSNLQSIIIKTNKIIDVETQKSNGNSFVIALDYNKTSYHRVTCTDFKLPLL